MMKPARAEFNRRSEAGALIATSRVDNETRRIATICEKPLQLYSLRRQSRGNAPVGFETLAA